MLEVRDIHFHYGPGRPWVLRGLDLDLKEGEIGVLLGRNGSGKTTLFQIILGILRPGRGTIRFAGEDLSALSRRERARRIAYVPQQIQFGNLTVFDSVLMGRVSFFGLRAGEEDRRAVEDLLREMGLEELALRSADELSGGEKQKVAIARAMAQQPRLLIFDEPTGNLDIANEQQFLEEARKLARDKGVAILCSLHDLNQAMELGDRFFFMKEGKTACSGGRELFRPDVIGDVFGIRVRRIEAEGRSVIVSELPGETSGTAGIPD